MVPHQIHNIENVQCRNAGHDIGHWPAGPTAIFSRRASRATSMHFLLARWATRQQIGPPVGLEDTGPTRLVALFAKPTQTTDSHQCIDGYLSPWGCSAWLCLALSLMTQLTAQSIMWLPDTATRLECIVYSAKSKHCSSGCTPLSKSVSVQVTIHNASSWLHLMSHQLMSTLSSKPINRPVSDK